MYCALLILDNSRWSLRHILYHNLTPTLYTFFFSLLDDFFSSTCSSLYHISYMYKTLFHASIRNKTNTYHCLFSTDTNWCYIQMCRKILMKLVILKNKCPTTQKRTADIVYRSQQRAYGTKSLQTNIISNIEITLRPRILTWMNY